MNPANQLATSWQANAARFLRLVPNEVSSIASNESRGVECNLFVICLQFVCNLFAICLQTACNWFATFYQPHQDLSDYAQTRF